MTLRDILGRMLVRWYMTLTVLAAAGCLTFAQNAHSGCYTTDTVVTFLLPNKSALQRYNGLTDSNVISFAGAIANEVNKRQPPQPYADADAPYYGAGLRRAVWVGVPSTGGQWMAAFSTATIEIKVVGPSATWVAQRQKAALTEIQAAVLVRQAATPRSGRISATVEPVSTGIYRISPSRSSRFMAYFAMSVAGIIGSAIASTALDGLIGRVRDARRRRPGPKSLALGVSP